MFFIDYDEAKVRHRGEQGRPCSDNDRYRSGPGQLPRQEAIFLGQFRVQHAYLESLFEASAGLRCQADLGHQVENLLALGDHLLNGFHVDLGLSGSGYAIQKGHGESGE